MMLRLSDEETAFYQAVANRLPQYQRPSFQERVAALLDEGTGRNRPLRFSN